MIIIDVQIIEDDANYIILTLIMNFFSKLVRSNTCFPVQSIYFSLVIPQFFVHTTLKVLYMPRNPFVELPFDQIIYARIQMKPAHSPPFSLH